MSVQVPITIVSGTNRKNSLTESVARYYTQVVQSKGVSATLLNLRDLPPDFTVSALYENHGKNKEFNVLAEVMSNSNKYIFILPQYNGTFPGVFKAFLDGLDLPAIFKKKKAALVGVSDGIEGCFLGTAHLSNVFNYLGMYVYPLKLRFPNVLTPTVKTLLKQKGSKALIDRQISEFIDY